MIKNKTVTGYLPRKVSRLCSLFAKEIVAEGMESEPLGSGSPSLALRNFLRDILVFFPIAINTLDLTVYPNFHCFIYSYIIIFRLIENFMFSIFVILLTYEIKSTTKFSRFTVNVSKEAWCYHMKIMNAAILSFTN